MLVQIELKKSPLMEILIGIRQELTILFDLLNLFEMLGQYFRCVWCSNPPRCFFDDFLNDIVLDDFANVDLVVCPLEYTILAGVLNFHVVEQLEPEIF